MSFLNPDVLIEGSLIFYFASLQIIVANKNYRALYTYIVFLLAAIIKLNSFPLNNSVVLA